MNRKFIKEHIDWRKLEPIVQKKAGVRKSGNPYTSKDLRDIWAGHQVNPRIKKILEKLLNPSGKKEKAHGSR